MIPLFRFRHGKVSLKTLHARTDRWKADRPAGKALFGQYRNRHLDDPSVADMPRDRANTNAILHGVPKSSDLLTRAFLWPRRDVPHQGRAQTTVAVTLKA